MRLFVALTPPPRAIDDLLHVRSILPPLPVGVRWTPPDQWHITLAFLGEVDDATAERLTASLGEVTAHRPPLDLALAGGGQFGGRVLWVGVTRDVDPLRRLAGAVGSAARSCRISVERRRFHPHVTVARTGAVHVPLAPLVDQLTTYTGPMWRADELHLVRSRLGAGPDGSAVHDVVSSWPLTTGA